MDSAEVVGITVALSGLMLVCLYDQSDCANPWKTDLNLRNTAWVVQADGPRNVCGRRLRERTQLELRHREGEGKIKTPRYCERREYKPGFYEIACPLPEKTNICIYPDDASRAKPYDLSRLPRLDNIDSRFLGLKADLKNPYYYGVYFPDGDFEAGASWPGTGQPTRWYLSKGWNDTYPTELSDRLWSKYPKAKYISIRNCANNDELAVFYPASANVELTIRNVSIDRNYPVPDYRGPYEVLDYLLWYYQLGDWDTPSGTCPTYTWYRKDAILPQCVSKGKPGCVYVPNAAGDSRYWPVMLAPRPKSGG
jgi:hypothetical protein